MSEPLVIIGRGEHARVVADAVLTDPRWHALGAVGPADSAATDETSRSWLPYLGDDDVFLASLAAQPSADRPAVVIGVGAISDPGSRREIVARYGDVARWASVVHGTAILSASARVGAGAVVLAGAVVGPNARIGEHAVVNSGAIVEHDVVIAPYAQVATGAIVGGGATVGDGAFVGLGARVRDHLAIGANAVVGMGAVVVKDVPPGVTVVGVPARPVIAT